MKITKGRKPKATVKFSFSFSLGEFPSSGTEQNVIHFQLNHQLGAEKMKDGNMKGNLPASTHISDAASE